MLEELECLFWTYKESRGSRSSPRLLGYCCAGGEDGSHRAGWISQRMDLLGALQKGGIVPEPLQGWGVPFPPPLPMAPRRNCSSQSSLMPASAAPSRALKETPTKELCAGTVSDQPLAHHRQTWVMIYAQLHQLISTDLCGCGVKLGKKGSWHARFPGVCAGKKREHPGQPSNWNSPQKMQKG